ncbi:hypothetical protein I601_3799 [Nocardioides dokdonensis FR1436]|uniref:Methionine/alanine importer small subunit n=1 Tax=Nocardioides dokdonensis FR1436 TaxID=1300347 RepID=A0A1A9GPI9_9ACTN|nr:methionine/alanine import family NSS transporter small subunit [Nocardioides dokdonensis]ANH40198.1 hypothetical protein I601_3799 [Nocardioides dokdonensis FR1436]
MSTSAIVMMVVAMLVIWGGLALAIINLNRSPATPPASEVHRDL